jgi:hypothetical protein
VTYNYTTLREEGDEATVKAKGKVMTKGKGKSLAKCSTGSFKR